jgi:hypothetical protein
MTREHWLEHNTPMAEVFFCDKINNGQLILVADGTYIPCEKSSNHQFQRETWLDKKKYNCIKPFIICTCDGKIVTIEGPFKATENDATIIQLILKAKHLEGLIQPGDIFVVDRGFRDAIEVLTVQHNLTVKSPECNL